MREKRVDSRRLGTETGASGERKVGAASTRFGLPSMDDLAGCHGVGLPDGR